MNKTIRLFDQNAFIKEFDTNVVSYKIDNYINKDLETIKTELTKNNMQVYVLGTGDKIINQYPKEHNKLYKGSVVALLTNDYDKKVPNFIGLSYKDSTNILKLMNVKYTIEGKGYVKEQSIKEGDTIKDDTTITLKLNKKNISQDIFFYHIKLTK